MPPTLRASLSHSRRTSADVEPNAKAEQTSHRCFDEWVEIGGVRRQQVLGEMFGNALGSIWILTARGIKRLGAVLRLREAGIDGSRNEKRHAE